MHRLLAAILRGRSPRQDLDELFVLGEHCSQREQRAELAERELTKVKLLNYLSGRIGEEMVGVITGVEEFGLFVQGVELPAEGLIHVSALADDYYRYDRASHTLAGHRAGNVFRLGDAIRVAVARVDVDRRELDFRLVKRVERPGRQGPDPRRGPSPAKTARGGRRKGAGKPGGGGSAAGRASAADAGTRRREQAGRDAGKRQKPAKKTSKKKRRRG